MDTGSRTRGGARGRSSSRRPARPVVAEGLDALAPYWTPGEVEALERVDPEREGETSPPLTPRWNRELEAQAVRDRRDAEACALPVLDVEACGRVLREGIDWTRWSRAQACVTLWPRWTLEQADTARLALLPGKDARRRMEGLSETAHQCLAALTQLVAPASCQAEFMDFWLACGGIGLACKSLCVSQNLTPCCFGGGFSLWRRLRGHFLAADASTRDSTTRYALAAFARLDEENSGSQGSVLVRVALAWLVQASWVLERAVAVVKARESGCRATLPFVLPIIYDSALAERLVASAPARAIPYALVLVANLGLGALPCLRIMAGHAKSADECARVDAALALFDDADASRRDGRRPPVADGDGARGASPDGIAQGEAQETAPPSDAKPPAAEPCADSWPLVPGHAGGKGGGPSFFAGHVARTHRNRLHLTLLLLATATVVGWMSWRSVLTDVLGPMPMDGHALARLPLSGRAASHPVVVHGIRVPGTDGEQEVSHPAFQSPDDRQPRTSGHLQLLDTGSGLLMYVGPQAGDGPVDLVGRLVTDPWQVAAVRFRALQGHPEWRERVLGSMVLVHNPVRRAVFPEIILGVVLLSAFLVGRVVVRSQGNPGQDPSILALRRFGDPREMVRHVDWEVQRGLHVRNIGPVTVTPSWLLYPGRFRIDCINVAELAWAYARLTPRKRARPLPEGMAEVLIERRAGPGLAFLAPMLEATQLVHALEVRAPWMQTGLLAEVDTRRDREAFMVQADVLREWTLATDWTFALAPETDAAPASVPGRGES